MGDVITFLAAGQLTSFDILKLIRWPNGWKLHSNLCNCEFMLEVNDEFLKFVWCNLESQLGYV